MSAVKGVEFQDRGEYREERRVPNVTRVRTRLDTWPILRRFRFAWVVLVLFPWCLQVRSIVQLALPHTLPQLLIPGGKIPMKKDVASHCPVQGQMIAGVWWNIWPTQFVESQDGDTLCHYVFPQYNSHGYYSIGSNSTAPPPKELIQTLPAHCSPDQNAIELYFYHGSIGYYSFYTAGRGVFCSEDATAYVILIDLGSADVNGRALALEAGGEKSAISRFSFWYICIGAIWIGYRTMVIHRSWVLCSQHVRRCERMNESLSNRGIIVFVQESARLVAHNASTPQRMLVLYALVEGLMADLFLQITKYGLSVRLQYFSIGYNLASLLSLLFDTVESRWRGSKATRVLLIIRRIFFNLETGFLGEAVGTAVLREYFESLNRSHLKDSLEPAPVMSYYFWSLFAHGIVVIGLAFVIVIVRGLGGLIVTCLRFRTIRVLAELNGVDLALRGRLRGVMLSGYIWRNGHLYYSRESLKAFGIFRSTVDINSASGAADIERGAQELLVHVDASWIGSITKANLVIVGSITGQHVDPFPVRKWSGQTLFFCDQMLGGSITS